MQNFDHDYVLICDKSSSIGYLSNVIHDMHSTNGNILLDVQLYCDILVLLHCN